MFSQSLRPPRATGTTWSKVSWEGAKRSPQYWQRVVVAGVHVRPRERHVGEGAFHTDVTEQAKHRGELHPDRDAADLPVVDGDDLDLALEEEGDRFLPRHDPQGLVGGVEDERLVHRRDRKDCAVRVRRLSRTAASGAGPVTTRRGRSRDEPARNSRARSVMTRGVARRSAARSTRSAPTPRAAAPALMKSSAVLRLTPPVGTRLDLGQGRLQGLDVARARRATPAGKTFTRSAPARHAVTTSVGVRAPGSTATPRSRQAAIVSRLSAGLTTKRAPASMHARAVSGSRTVPAPTRASGARRVDLRDEAHGAGHGHRDLEDRQAAGLDGVDGAQGLVGRLGADDGDEAGGADALDDLFLSMSAAVSAGKRDFDRRACQGAGVRGARSEDEHRVAVRVEAVAAAATASA